VTNFINWLKNNPITVVAFVIVLLAAGVFGYTHLVNTSLQERMQSQARPLGSLDSLKNQTIMFPNADPTQPEKQVRNVSINPPIIERFRQIYGQFDQQYRDLYQIAVARNQLGKQPMLDGLFPTPDTFGRPFDAKNEYLRQLRSFLESPGEQSPSAEGLFPAALNAGLATDPSRLDNEVADAEQATYSAIVSRRGEARETGLTDDERDDILAAKRQRYIDILQDTATQIDVYVDAMNPRDPYSPFEVMPWAVDDGSPAIPNVWEGQMQLWVLQDLVSAIAMANAQAAESSDRQGVPASVVKRLLSIRVLPGYVGLTSSGMAGDEVSATANPDRYITSPTETQPVNFVVSPTGRTTNGIYLVRHAEITAHVAFNKLPLLVNAIDATNFASVIDVDFVGVSPYETLAQRYFYGGDDVVEATIRVESLWFRDWLSPLMPDTIRTRVAQPDSTPRRGGRRG
jgi:hypothetical protein